MFCSAISSRSCGLGGTGVVRKVLSVPLVLVGILVGVAVRVRELSDGGTAAREAPPGSVRPLLIVALGSGSAPGAVEIAGVDPIWSSMAGLVSAWAISDL